MPNWAFKSLAIVGAMLLATTLLAQEETLLSRNATYQITGQGYIYPGQVQPGINLRAPHSGWMATPLVEETDSGDLLIDGNIGVDSMVYAPWYWTSQAKRITITMTLPGPSQVSRVTVYLPPDPEYQPKLGPETVFLSVRAAEGEWQEVQQPVADSPDRTATAWTFRLPAVDAYQLKITVSEDKKAHIGVTEIAVYGEGPTENPTRGLIRSTPHIETISEPQPSMPPGSVLLTKPGKTKLTLSGTPLTSGEAGMLVDGDRTTLVRIDSKPHQHLKLTADLDLGSSYLIEAVNVWMPGGQGRVTGHVHDLMVAISPDAEGGIWQTPTDLVVNPYWPSDEAPSPYVIPIGGLKVVGRRVRVTVTLSGTGGVTNRLAMAEIEVWGRAVPEGAAAPVRLDMRPVVFKPEPRGKLPAKLQWLTTDKVHGAWIGDDLFDKFPGTDKTKAEVLADAGFNLVRVSMGVDRSNRDTSPDLENRLAPNVAEAHRVGLHLLIGWQYGSSHQEPYRKYRAPGGQLAERSCCPLDTDYIERHIGRWAIAIAKGGADGMLIDTEMYESDETNYPGPCVCDACFAEYLKTYADDWQTLYNQIPAERRGLWLSANGAAQHYARHQAKRIEAQYDKIRERCQKINPGFLFGHAPLLGHVPGLERGLGTSSVPCLVFSEREYTNGPSSQSFANVRRIQEEGIPTLYIPGAFLVQQSPEKVATSALISSLYCDGWWLYYATAVLTHPAADDPEAFSRSYGRVKGTSARDYLDRITAVHQRLDQLLKEPRNNWPRPAQLPPTPAAEVHRRAGAIAIDGKLDDPAWQHATQLELTLSRWGDAVGPPTTVWACWDEQAFYVAARCQLPKDTALDVPQRGRDNGSMWQFDGIEVFRYPGKSTRRYAHFVISALGDIYDALVNPEVGGTSGNSTWSINAEAAATHTDTEYRVEARIPFAPWANTPKANDVWGANFCRFRPSEQTWSPTYAGFHTPTRFGTLTFR